MAPFECSCPSVAELDAGTGKINSVEKEIAHNFAEGKTIDSNGDFINRNERSTWDYGHLKGFEKRHLEAFAAELGMNQEELSAMINSTIMIEIQNRHVNRSHTAEEFNYKESMREIMMATLDHLPERIRERLYMDDNGTDILFKFDDSLSINLTPANMSQIKSDRAKKAFKFDKNKKKQL